MRWVLLIAWYIMFHEVTTLVLLFDSSKLVARAQAVRWIVPLEVPRLLERRSGLTVPRERSLNQLMAQQSPPRPDNSWRFSLDLGYVGE